MYISTLHFHFFIKFNMILNMAGTGIINTDRIKGQFCVLSIHQMSTNQFVEVIFLISWQGKEGGAIGL